MKKNIWIINQYNMPPELGHLNRHYYFAKELYELGYKPTVFVGSYLHNTDIQMIYGKEKFIKYSKAEFDYYFIKTMNYKGSVFKRVIAMLQFYFNLKKSIKYFEKPDIVLGSSAHPLNAILALKLAKKYSVKSIIEIRDLWPESFISYGIMKKKSLVSKLLYLGEKKLYIKADSIIFTMEGGVDYIRHKKWDIDNGGKIDLKKIYHINNGIDLLEYYNRRTRYLWEDEDLTNPKTFKVIYVGSIRKVNKISRIVDICEQLNGNSKIAVLVFGDGDEKNKLKEISENKKLNNLKFKGHIEKKYIPFVLSNSNLNLIIGENNTVFNYGLSANKMFDYFASGKPTLQTFKTNYSILEKFHAGVELNEYDLNDVVNSINHFYNMGSTEYNKYSQGANEAAEFYDYKNLAKKLVEVIER
ncbi:MAG: glycosyltransferase family 4 protein [Acholeplasma sp.]|nr:glycosyltransferase family 4 protein [Acholeplasma sp.]